MQVSKHFTLAEMTGAGRSPFVTAPKFMEALEDLRKAYGHPMHVTSACRSRQHNAEVGGSAGSFHLTANPKYEFNGAPLATCAVDIVMPDPAFRHRLIRLATEGLWTVGINFTRNFIHLDRRSDYTDLPPVIFSYGE